MRVTNWGYGVQISSVHVAKGEKLIKIPNFGRNIEVIGDSLSSGYSATLEGLSSYAYGAAAGLGETEYSITAYPGICLFDKQCYGNVRGMFHQWYYTEDTSGRPNGGGKPEVWDFSKQQDADIVIINIGTNDQNSANGPVPPAAYAAQYQLLIEGVHTVWPNAQIILVVSKTYSLRSSPLIRTSLSGLASMPMAIHTLNLLMASCLRFMVYTNTLTPSNTFKILSYMIPLRTPPINHTSPVRRSSTTSIPLG
jgi:hypothetical protein